MAPASPPAAHGQSSASSVPLRPLRVILGGYGQVGKNFHELIQTTNSPVRVVAIARRAGAAIDEKGLEPNPRFDRDTPLSTLIESIEADAFVDALPTDIKSGEPGLSLAKAAFKRGLHVVTADKGPIVHGFADLARIAHGADRQLRFEATVGGAIPTLNLVEHGFAGNPVDGIQGILNGTSNFILTRMLEDGMEFGAALEEARELGYAEADPTNDVDGWDAAAKLTILANAVLGVPIRFADVERQGIREITSRAMRIAKDEGYAVRLLASVDRETGRASVRPRLIPERSGLNVGGVLNVVRYRTRYGGSFTVTGRGAGGRETATAVLADVLSLPRPPQA
ncbi:MAG: homoserine dehydrogenase [Thermoplasmatota archaeon]